MVKSDGKLVIRVRNRFRQIKFILEKPTENLVSVTHSATQTSSSYTVGSMCIQKRATFMTIEEDIKKNVARGSSETALQLNENQTEITFLA